MFLAISLPSGLTRGTDVKDAEWIADLVAHGLIRPSYVPPRPLRELRKLTRYRRKLIEVQAAERNRLRMQLASANIKLASVATDVLGVSGREMLRALIKGEAGPDAMAELARGRLRAKRAELTQALRGRMDETQRILLGMQLRRVEQTEELERRIDERLKPYRAEMALLMQIPGVDRVNAAVVIAEIGIDMTVFLSVHHLAAPAFAGAGSGPAFARPAMKAPASAGISACATATNICARRCSRRRCPALAPREATSGTSIIA